MSKQKIKQKITLEMLALSDAIAEGIFDWNERFDQVYVAKWCKATNTDLFKVNKTICALQKIKNVYEANARIEQKRSSVDA